MQGPLPHARNYLSTYPGRVAGRRILRPEHPPQKPDISSGDAFTYCRVVWFILKVDMDIVLHKCITCMRQRKSER